MEYCGVKYVVTICDKNPLETSEGNRIRYQFSSSRKALKMMEQGFISGYVVVMERIDVYKYESESEDNYEEESTQEDIPHIRNEGRHDARRKNI